ncbi:MAG: hypothetical protein EOO61_09095 [Hymenobacter sp.]|nr:MAG: hypothetical protein EOO61_09095 [Hymenobacter sp.]
MVDEFCNSHDRLQYVKKRAKAAASPAVGCARGSGVRDAQNPRADDHRAAPTPRRAAGSRGRHG